MALSPYQRAQLEARRKAGELAESAARKVLAEVRAYGERVAAQIAALPATTPFERRAALERTRTILLNAGDRLQSELAKIIGSGRGVAFTAVHDLWQQAGVEVAAIHDIPDALLGAVKRPPVTLLGAYENLGGAASTWRTRLTDYTKATAQDLDGIVRTAISEGMSPEQLAKKLRPYVKGAEEFYKAFPGDGEVEQKLRDLRALKSPELRDAARKLQYNARRIAYSELHNARAEAELTHFAVDPMVGGIIWTLSPMRGTTDVPDECDAFARVVWYDGYPAGWWPLAQVPSVPHPHDRCERVPWARDPKEIHLPKPNPSRSLDPADLTIPGNYLGFSEKDLARVRRNVGVNLAHATTQDIGAAMRNLMAKASADGAALHAVSGDLQQAILDAKKVLTRADVILGEQLSGQKGSNEGGLFLGTDGVKRYVKFYKDPLQPKTEQLANTIYNRLGLKAPTSELFEVEGKLAYASEWMDGVETFESLGISPALADQALDGFAADVLTGNWDALGLVNDNMGIAAGKAGVIRLDNGGAFLLRAQGERKPVSLLGKITEWEGFAPGGINQQYQQLFKKAGILNADSLGQRVVDQIDRIVDLEQLSGGWRNFMDSVTPGFADTADGKQILGMLEQRSTLLLKKRNAIAHELAQATAKAAAEAAAQAKLAEELATLKQANAAAAAQKVKDLEAELKGLGVELKSHYDDVTDLEALVEMADNALGVDPTAAFDGLSTLQMIAKQGDIDIAVLQQKKAVNSIIAQIKQATAEGNTTHAHDLLTILTAPANEPFFESAKVQQLYADLKIVKRAAMTADKLLGEFETFVAEGDLSNADHVLHDLSKGKYSKHLPQLGTTAEALEKKLAAAKAASTITPKAKVLADLDSLGVKVDPMLDFTPEDLNHILGMATKAHAGDGAAFSELIDFAEEIGDDSTFSVTGIKAWWKGYSHGLKLNAKVADAAATKKLSDSLTTHFGVVFEDSPLTLEQLGYLEQDLINAFAGEGSAEAALHEWQNDFGVNMKKTFKQLADAKKIHAEGIAAADATAKAGLTTGHDLKSLYNDEWYALKDALSDETLDPSTVKGIHLKAYLNDALEEGTVASEQDLMSMFEALVAEQKATAPVQSVAGDLKYIAKLKYEYANSWEALKDGYTASEVGDFHTLGELREWLGAEKDLYPSIGDEDLRLLWKSARAEADGDLYLPVHNPMEGVLEGLGLAEPKPTTTNIPLGDDLAGKLQKQYPKSYTALESGWQSGQIGEYTSGHELVDFLADHDLYVVNDAEAKVMFDAIMQQKGVTPALSHVEQLMNKYSDSYQAILDGIESGDLDAGSSATKLFNVVDSTVGGTQATAYDLEQMLAEALKQKGLTTAAKAAPTVAAPALDPLVLAQKYPATFSELEFALENGDLSPGMSLNEVVDWLDENTSYGGTAKQAKALFDFLVEKKGLGGASAVVQPNVTTIKNVTFPKLLTAAEEKAATKLVNDYLWYSKSAAKNELLTVYSVHGSELTKAKQLWKQTKGKGKALAAAGQPNATAAGMVHTVPKPLTAPKSYYFQATQKTMAAIKTGGVDFSKLPGGHIGFKLEAEMSALKFGDSVYEEVQLTFTKALTYDPDKVMLYQAVADATNKSFAEVAGMQPAQLRALLVQNGYDVILEVTEAGTDAYVLDAKAITMKGIPAPKPGSFNPQAHQSGWNVNAHGYAPTQLPTDAAAKGKNIKTFTHPDGYKSEYDAQRLMEAQHDRNMMALTREQKTAVQEYTGSSHDPWNEHLRNRLPPDEEMKHLDRVLDNTQVGHNVITFRGIGPRHPLKQMGMDKVRKLIGQEFEDLGYSSTSTKRSVAISFSGGTNWIFELHVPSAAKGAFVESITSVNSEMEVLLARGTKVRIKDVIIEPNNGAVRVIAEVLPYAKRSIR